VITDSNCDWADDIVCVTTWVKLELVPVWVTTSTICDVLVPGMPEYVDVLEAADVDVPLWLAGGIVPFTVVILVVLPCSVQLTPGCPLAPFGP
jgi:uncharacterized protein YcsI (UPF0317 family)